MTETEAFRSKLRDLAEARLSLYTREMGEDFYGKLIANKANWRAGYVSAHDCYWCTPQTDKGLYVVGPFTAIKWSHGEMLALLGGDAELGQDLWQRAFEAGAVPRVSA